MHERNNTLNTSNATAGTSAMNQLLDARQHEPTRPLRDIIGGCISSDQEVIQNKELRRSIDTQIQTLKALPPSRERSLAITKLQEAVMWLGMDLKRLGEQNPYPNSKDPSNTTIDPTADGLKL